MEASVKPGEKKPVTSDEINYELSDQAKAVLLAQPKTEKEKAKLERLIQKHKNEYAKLMNLMDENRRKRNMLQNKRDELSKSISPNQLKFFTMIEKECGEFLKAVKSTKRFLYRGMRGNEPVLIGYPHEDRAAKDTKEVTQKLFDDLLTLANFKAKRSNSIFTTGSRSQARNYGDSVYIIFPKDGYNFTWTPQHEDWIPTFHDVVGNDIGDIKLNNVGYHFDYLADALSDMKYEFSKFKNSMKYKKWKSKRLQPGQKIEDALEDTSDVDEMCKKMDSDPLAEELRLNAPWVYKLLHSKQHSAQLTKEEWKKLIQTIKDFKALEAKYDYQFYNLDDDEWREMLDKILAVEDKHIDKVDMTKKDAEEFVKKHELKNDDMIGALNSTNEIYINGEYIAIRAINFENSANKYFLNGESKTEIPFEKDERMDNEPRAVRAANQPKEMEVMAKKKPKSKKSTQKGPPPKKPKSKHPLKGGVNPKYS